MGLLQLSLELLKLVLCHLDTKEIVGLAQCDKKLYKVLMDILFASEFIAAIAMVAGCRKGNHDTIRLAVARGASLDLLLVPATQRMKNQQQKPRPPVRRRPLVLALGADQPKTFRYLIELGANVRSFGLTRQLYAIATLKPQYFKIFLEVGLDKQDRSWSGAVGGALLKAAERHSGLDDFQLLLDLGADPNFLVYHPGSDVITPFCAAIAYRMDDAVRLMVKYGADLRGPRARDEKLMSLVNPKYVPMFMAVQNLATTGSSEMLEVLLEFGVNINTIYKVPHQYLNQRGLASGLNTTYCIGPLCVYLDSFNLWDGKDREGDNCAMKGLKYLLSLGILSEDNENIEFDIATDADNEQKVEAVLTLTILLSKWTVEGLADDNFNQIVLAVAELGVSPTRLKSCLASIPWLLAVNEVALERWKGVLGQLLQSYPAKVINQLLYDFLLSLGETMRNPGFSTQSQNLVEVTWRTLEQLDFSNKIPRGAQVTVEAFLSAGADINARCQSHFLENRHAKDRPSALYELCTDSWDLSRDIKLMSWEIFPTIHRRMNTRRLRYVEYLLEKGADPSVVVCGTTATQRMLAACQQLEDDEQKVLVMNLVKTLHQA